MKKARNKYCLKILYYVKLKLFLMPWIIEQIWNPEPVRQSLQSQAEHDIEDETTSLSAKKPLI